MASIQKKLENWPFIGFLIRLSKSIKIPGLNGLTLYHLLEIYIIGIAKGALSIRAKAIAFSFFSAIFPFLLFILVLIPYIPIEGFDREFQFFLESFLPPKTSDFFFDNIFQNINTRDANKGLLSSVFVLSLFLMANGINAIFSSFENTYHEQLNRNAFHQFLYALGVSLLLSFLLLTTVAFYGYAEIYVVQNLVDYGYLDDEEFWVIFTKYMFLVIVTYLGISILYFFGNKEWKKSRFFSIGAFFTTLLYVLNSFLFGLYINNFSKYNELYGSIGALLILMLYLWLNANILLLGYELNASLKQLTKNTSNTH